jgi:hypothetical protein
MRRTEHNRLKQRRASQAAMLVAAAAVPNTYQKTLMPRSTINQGAITGVTMAIDYLIVSTIRKYIEDAADNMAGTVNSEGNELQAHRRQKQFALTLDLTALLAGAAGQKYFAAQESEKDSKAILRTGSTWLKYSAIAGLSIVALDTLFGNSSTKDEKMPARYKTPWGLIGGAAFAIVMDYRRRQAKKLDPDETKNSANPAVLESWQLWQP